MTQKKLVILGGSSLNTPAFFAAIAHASSLAFDEICLVGRSDEAVESVGQFCRSISQCLDIPTRVTWDTDIRRAAADARYVLNTLRAGGIEGQVEDRKNLALSGIVGHAAGYAEAIRNIPPTLDAIRKIETVAPDTVFINFTNPVSLVCEAVATVSSIMCVGICYHAFSTRDDFASLLQVHPEQVHVEYFGLNHLGWVADVHIDGRSRMSHLVNAIIEQKVKKYNYQVIEPFGLIPIDHAFSLYRKGEVLYVRQKGIRGSLKDVLFKYVAPPTSWLRRKRHIIEEAIQDGKVEGLDTLKTQAPWYAKCIVPFLEALDSGKPSEFIVTWEHGGQISGLPGMTAESTAIVEDHRVRGMEFSAKLPGFAVAWLHQIRDSERLLICAIQEHSFDVALQSLAIHPNVASVDRAKRFLQYYFPREAQNNV